MDNIIIFSQNVQLESLINSNDFSKANNNVFLTPHMLFSNEREYIQSKFKNCIFYKFNDLVSDTEAEKCDVDAFDPHISVSEYYEVIKRKKNEILYKKIVSRYPNHQGYICSNDLGIYSEIWLAHGFRPIILKYYYDRIPVGAEGATQSGTLKKIIKKIPGVRRLKNNKIQKARESQLTEEVYQAHYKGKKYIFIGKLSRVSYRMDMEWERSNEDIQRMKKGIFENKNSCVYLSTLHENWKCPIPDSKAYDIRFIQDGYLPPNYTSRYLNYRQKNVQYYAWDVLGEEIFKNHDVPVSIMPFRKKLFLPYPEFKDTIRTILVATSGPGDWTALKNRADEDLMLQAFVEIANKFPNIHIIYRCHPTWTHPDHNGVNSIHRAAEFIEYSGLNNIKISGNIPKNDNNMTLSFSRSSFEEDLKNADIVFGEHSVSMLDGGLKKLPFASVNLTGRRNFFCGITRFGFPHCESIDEIIDLINNYNSLEFRRKYRKAVDRYNEMTDLQ